MSLGPLRTEFLLTGAALLAAFVGLLEVCGVPAAEAVFVSKASTLSVGALGLIVLASYVVGLVSVQLTFFWPTQQLVERVRASRFDELEADDLEYLRGSFSPSDSPVLAQAFGAAVPLRPGPTATPPRVSAVHAQSAALTFSRAAAPAEIAEEYKYRRANRQLFVGMLPASAIGGATGIIAIGRSGWSWLPMSTGVLGAFCVTAALLLALYRSAEYQEKIAQAMLIDVAFLRRWKTLPGS